jgi:hypothetical protein
MRVSQLFVHRTISLYTNFINVIWWAVCRRVYPKVSGLIRSRNTRLQKINTHREATKRVMASELARLTRKIALRLHVVAESCTICSSRSRRQVWKLLDTPSCVWVTSNCLFPSSGFLIPTCPVLLVLPNFIIPTKLWSASCISFYILLLLPLFSSKYPPQHLVFKYSFLQLVEFQMLAELSSHSS